MQATDPATKAGFLMPVLNAHPASALFPLMTAAELQELTEDIRQHGQRTLIAIYDGQILDGRNRYAACQALGIQPKTAQWNGQGGSPTAFVLSMNLYRRHLSASQKAAVAVDVLPLLEAEAKERQRAALSQGNVTQGKTGWETIRPRLDESSEDKPSPVDPAPQLVGRSDEQAAKAVGVSRSYVAQAKAIKEEAPDLLEQVRSGEKTIPEAKRELEQRQTQAVIDAAGDDDGGLQRARLKSAFSRALRGANELVMLTPSMLVEVLDDGDFQALEMFVESANTWLGTIKATRQGGLRVIDGGLRG